MRCTMRSGLSVWRSRRRAARSNTDRSRSRSVSRTEPPSPASFSAIVSEDGSEIENLQRQTDQLALTIRVTDAS
eukprot:574007-Rhodomonas_salina.2